MTLTFDYVDTDAALADVIQICRRRAVVSVDTEFARTNTYYPVIGLVQIYDGEQCYIVDPLALSTLAPLAALLTDPAVRKVFHSCSEDLEVFQYAVGCVPTPVFDTQIAAAVAGVSFSISYQNLVEHHLGHTIPKEETRSDWLRRPLSESQLEYAALDVIYLLAVYEHQLADLADQGKTDWVEAECAELGREIATSIDPDQFYLRVRSAARMTPRELNVFRALCAWREKLARELNMPRNRLVDEKALATIARGEAGNRQALQEVAGLTSRQVRKFGDDLLELVARAGRVPESEFPVALEDPTAPNIRNDQIKLLKKVVQERADTLRVAPEMLAKRRHLEQLLRSGGTDGNYRLPAALTGWRTEAIGEPLLAALMER